jgi:hypothetical protein
MAQTFIAKGNIVTNPSDNDFGRAVFVRITATADVTGILELANGSTKLAEFYLEDGNTIILEKKADEKITCGTSKASAVGSPRS